MSAEALCFETSAAWRGWLDVNHATNAGVWLQIAKKGSKAQLISIDEARDVSLCYGWIDSHRKGFDATSFLQRYSPRTARSPWSQKNREHAERLMEQGFMTPFGLHEIEKAKRDGRWQIAYAPQR